jgi:nucleotide-binding universal stress UspA family protein
MIKTILTPLLGDGSDENVLGFAHAAAAQLAAHIYALHVSRNPVDDVVRLTIGDGVITRELWNAIERDIRDRHDRARHSFDAFCNARAIQIRNVPNPTPAGTASWHEVEGDPAAETSLRARFNDLVVVGRGDNISGFSPRELGEILVRSGRPVLISSRKTMCPKMFETIAIGWKDTLETAHMMTAAMPLLETAKRVVVLLASENSHEEINHQHAERLTAELEWHGIKPEIRRLIPKEVSVAEALVDAARKAGADLLALGGYGHSRAREFVFGGVTRYMLEAAHFPVLIVH